MIKQVIGEVMDKRILKFKLCDSRFFSYLENVLNRLPEEVKEYILNSEDFQILSSEDFHEAYGLYWNFDNPAKDFVYLSTMRLGYSEEQIIYTIAHELAQHGIGKGVTGAYEKEAEAILGRREDGYSSGTPAGETVGLGYLRRVPTSAGRFSSVAEAAL